MAKWLANFGQPQLGNSATGRSFTRGYLNKGDTTSYASGIMVSTRGYPISATVEGYAGSDAVSETVFGSAHQPRRAATAEGFVSASGADAGRGI